MIKHRNPPNKLSLKKIAEINAEAPIRIELCKRAGGKPMMYEQKYKRNDGTVHTIKRVRCVGGFCECYKVDKEHNCGKLPANAINGQLEPHEYILSRGRGGHLSLRNSAMILRACHRRLDGRNPKFQWLEKD